MDAVNKKMDSYLGTELDFTTSYALQKEVTASAGYSQMFGTNTLERLKGGNANHDNNWVWVSINPRLFGLK